MLPARLQILGPQTATDYDYTAAAEILGRTGVRGQKPHTLGELAKLNMQELPADLMQLDLEEQQAGAEADLLHAEVESSEGDEDALQDAEPDNDVDVGGGAEDDLLACTGAIFASQGSQEGSPAPM